MENWSFLLKKVHSINHYKFRNMCNELSATLKIDQKTWYSNSISELSWLKWSFMGHCWVHLFTGRFGLWNWKACHMNLLQKISQTKVLRFWSTIRFTRRSQCSSMAENLFVSPWLFSNTSRRRGHRNPPWCQIILMIGLMLDSGSNSLKTRFAHNSGKHVYD